MSAQHATEGGGPALPVVVGAGGIVAAPGLSRRDVFALVAMHALIGRYGPGGIDDMEWQSPRIAVAVNEVVDAVMFTLDLGGEDPVPARQIIVEGRVEGTELWEGVETYTATDDDDALRQAREDDARVGRYTEFRVAQGGGQ